MSESVRIDSIFVGRTMPKSYSGDLWTRVIEAVEEGASRRSCHMGGPRRWPCRRPCRCNWHRTTAMPRNLVRAGEDHALLDEVMHQPFSLVS